MGPHGRDDDRAIAPRLHEGVEAGTAEEHARDTELVFDFTGLRRPGLCDLSLILTARLAAGDGERVWVRALPNHTWHTLEALGLTHLFSSYPSPDSELN